MTVHALKRKRYIYLFAAAISFLVLDLVYAWSLFATPYQQNHIKEIKDIRTQSYRKAIRISLTLYKF